MTTLTDKKHPLNSSEIEIGSLINISSAKSSFDHCEIIAETGKAFQFSVDSSQGSYLHEYNFTFWLPKSIVFKSITFERSFGATINLPFWFSISTNKTKIN